MRGEGRRAWTGECWGTGGTYWGTSMDGGFWGALGAALAGEELGQLSGSMGGGGQRGQCRAGAGRDGTPGEGQGGDSGTEGGTDGGGSRGSDVTPPSPSPAAPCPRGGGGASAGTSGMGRGRRLTAPPIGCGAQATARFEAPPGGRGRRCRRRHRGPPRPRRVPGAVPRHRIACRAPPRPQPGDRPRPRSLRIAPGWLQNRSSVRRTEGSGPWGEQGSPDQ